MPCVQKCAWVMARHIIQLHDLTYQHQPGTFPYSYTTRSNNSAMISKEDELPREWHLKSIMAWAEQVYFFVLVRDATVLGMLFSRKRMITGAVCLLHWNGEMIHRPPREQLSRLEISMREFRRNSHRALAQTLFCHGDCVWRAQVRLLKTHFPQSQLASILRAHAEHAPQLLTRRKNCGEKSNLFFAQNTMKASASF